MVSKDPTVGALVEVPAGRGVVRFAGPTSFSKGHWIGIELFEANGKNDGTVQGARYFACKPNHGVFVRPSQVKVLESASESAPPTPRVAPGHQRRESAGLARTGSVRAPPGSSRTFTPAKPSAPTVPALTPGHSPSISSATKRTPALTPLQSARASISRKGSISSEAQSPTTARQRNFDAQAQLSTPSRPSIARPSPLASAASAPPPAPAPALSSLRQGVSPEPESPILDEPPPRMISPPVPPMAQPALALPLAPTPVLDDRELQELRVKVAVLEAKRADDARHVRELETRLAEAESFVALRPKLQAKLHEQQTELIATRRELADAQQLAQLADGRIVDAQEQLEMAMLDKEMAEERAEVAEADLEEVKESLAQLEVELQVLREGGSGQENSEIDVKQSLEYIQLEKQNERLKEALVRLRDITQENELENRRRIADMEKDVTSLDEIQSQYESALIKLANAEQQVEDLKLQLDDALGAEEMLVHLTERNLMLSEKIEEMRITIEDLEALKELNDELEENHVETEKAMQEDLNAKDIQIQSQARKIQSLEDACQDLESTIVQFRDLVTQLQNELDALRAETQTAQQESSTAVSQAAAMMSLNMKLQSSASKNQARNIDLEVKRIEARETRELLSIIQPYLPQVYVESDMDATNCYLFFQRLALKVELINSTVAQTHNIPEALNGPVSELLVGVCEMRGRLSQLATTCKRFAAILRRCDVESFLNIGRIFPEIAPMEKRIDMHIDLLRREEFREVECVSDAAKMQVQFDHLAETYFKGYDYDLGERELGHALSFDNDLDMFAASMGLIKTSVAAITKDEEVELKLEELDAEEDFFAHIQQLLEQCRSAKIISKKLMKRIEELTQESSALKSQLVPQIQALCDKVPELVNFGISLAQQVMPHLADVRGSKAPFQLATVLSFVKQTAASTVGKYLKEDVSSWNSISEFLSQVMQEANRLLPMMMETEHTMKISGIPPWVLRIDDIKAATAINIEAERRVAQLNDEMQALVRSLKAKDQNTQEASVKIELMERRMEAMRKQADQIADLEGELQKARKQERAYEEAMEQLQADLDALEQDNTKLKSMASNPEKQPSGPQMPEPESMAVEGNLETSYLLEQIEALRGTVHFLRTENSYLKGQDLLREIESLPPLLEPVNREPTPPLVPSTLSDSEDSEDDLATPPNLRTLNAESKLLYRDVIKYTTSPRVVDLSVLRARREEAAEKGFKPWIPKKKTPAYQVYERKLEGERLGRRLQGLLERTNLLAGAGAAR